VLAGDFGGTRSRVALFESDDGVSLPRLAHQTIYAAHEFAGVGDVVARFLAEQGADDVRAACLGVAGAVDHNRVRLTNLGWDVDGDALSTRLGFRLELINDLVATALGMSALGSADLRPLNPDAEEAHGNAVLLGAGTGLGVALLVWNDGKVLAVPSEGGHAELAARDDEEWALRRFLATRFGGRVSAERVVSGQGIKNLYDFLVAQGGEPTPEVATEVATGDAARAISEAGLAGSCELCARALDLFASLFGSFAGDLALTGGAHGGVYLAGGVATKLADKLADGTFLRAFVDKGRLRPFVERVPVHILLREDAGIWGAARRAAEIAAQAPAQASPGSPTSAVRTAGADRLLPTSRQASDGGISGGSE
jgi:glucokinase